jgi:hypothetical protein
MTPSFSDGNRGVFESRAIANEYANWSGSLGLFEPEKVILGRLVGELALDSGLVHADLRCTWDSIFPGQRQDLTPWPMAPLTALRRVRFRAVPPWPESSAQNRTCPLSEKAL